MPLWHHLNIRLHIKNNVRTVLRRFPRCFYFAQEQMNLVRFRAGCAESKPFGINWRSSNVQHDAIHVLYGL